MRVLNMLPKRAWMSIVFALTSGACQAQTKAPTAIERLKTARDAVEASEVALARVNVETKVACADADAADAQLLKEGTLPSLQTQSLAKAAILKRDLCDQWQQSGKRAKANFEVARTSLRQIAIESVDPAVDQDDLSPSPALASGIPSIEEMISLVGRAQGVQEKVDKERKAADGVYDVVDGATKKALALHLPTDAQLAASSKSLQRLASEAHAAVSVAQQSANRLLEHALTVKSCLLAATPKCKVQHYVAHNRAIGAEKDMSAALALSKLRRNELDAAARVIAVAESEVDLDRRVSALRFAELIEKYPEAGAPFAQNGFTLLASNKETSATIKLGWDRLYAGGWREVTLLFSAPLTGSASSKVFNFADGLTGIPKVGLSYLLLDARPLLGTQTGLFSLSTGFRLGSETRSYYTDGPAFPKSASSVRVWPASVSVAAVGHDPSTRRAHVLRASWQHAFEDGPAKNRCPVDRTGDVLYVDCITGSFGAPEAQNEGVLSYQYRYQNERESFAASPSLTHNTRTRVTEFGLPIFLWHSEEAGKRSFNTGIRLDWTSKGKESITGRTKNEWSFGIFVGAPFTLFGRAD